MRFYKYFIYFPIQPGVDRKISIAIVSDDIIIWSSNVMDQKKFSVYKVGTKTRKVSMLAKPV